MAPDRLLRCSRRFARAEHGRLGWVQRHPQVKARVRRRPGRYRLGPAARREDCAVGFGDIPDEVPQIARMRGMVWLHPSNETAGPLVD